MDLATDYMGLSLGSPLVASASPLSEQIDTIRRLEDAGAAAVVLHSLFEEQIEHEARELDYYLQYGAERFAESLTYFPQAGEFKLGPEEYLDHVAKAKAAVDIPVIASLNGISRGGWISYARNIEQAGADALELNVYFIPTDPRLTSHQVESVYTTILGSVSSSVTIPVAVKLSPYFSSLSRFAADLVTAGAKALVLFNRFYQPDINVTELAVAPRLVLSTSEENRLPLRWMALLYGRTKAGLAATTGIHTAEDVAKMILAGADVTMMCSALLRNGVEHLKTVRAGLEAIMASKGYGSVSEMRGVLSQKSCPEPAAFERANYMKTLRSYRATGTFE